MKRASLYDSYQFVLDDLTKAYDYMEPEEGAMLVASDYYDSPYFNEFYGAGTDGSCISLYAGLG